MLKSRFNLLMTQIDLQNSKSLHLLLQSALLYSLMKRSIFNHSILCISLILIASAGPLQDLSTKIKTGLNNAQYSVHTADTHQTMDCLKISQAHDENFSQFGIFHTSNSQTHFSQLFYAEYDESSRMWRNTTKISDRGSQGFVKRVVVNGKGLGYLVGYELQNQNGNKIAIRYYENQQKIKINNFLYEYQLLQIVSNKQMRNIGTVSIEQIQLLKQQSDPKFNQYLVNIKFHYCPDGSHDFPGMGFVNLKPLRDFVDAKGNWKGGCFENYRDWTGSQDTVAEGALRQAGCLGKIGQRDYFYIGTEKYYLYQCNLNPNFDWESWRIALYSPSLKQARIMGLALGNDADLANPHITLKKKNSNSYEFMLTFFLPGEGIKPDVQAKGGQSIVYTSFTYP